ncbi:MAG TPA: FHIPEP family type III secretion protein, partial [Polyangia bacterium]
HTRGAHVLAVYFVDTMIEETLRESIQRQPNGDTLALEPDLAADIVRAVGRAVARASAPVIVTAADLRIHLRRLIAADQPQVAVLTYQEIEPGVKLESLGRISVSQS